MTRLHLDWTRCDGHGACTELLADLLTTDEWGYPRPLSGEREPAVDSTQVRRAERAVAACPLMALSLVRA